ncbi:MAG: 4-alpha-glucanotransferase [Bacteroidetes bacterium GWF2_38_335]|nr:MAG: 4-alpha-glucanotransferase [Bacteroidetes bacterium GWF2_38_335]OFY81862.1 MAG: 4-alpha-glucanotransferase [Bacteroidetes bacterium RIFOXYA12_FULL_38_20]HBS87939.1 4-alpha-glucanotransferase [Bacteroidales bacterium]
MKVLMFGWEFPPHITGGLGTACYGLTKGLAHFGVDMIFVVPKSYGDEDESFLRLRDAGQVALSEELINYEEFWKKITYLEVGSTLIPYMSPEEFELAFEGKILDHTEIKKSVISKHFKFSGTYGKNLMHEVSRYALIAAAIAETNQFDVIHSHDWLTYPAGIAAKEVSGKPLVIHVHATEFDRSGEHINHQVFDIEKKGMEVADKVITVSNLTRNIVIERYGIDPDKVVTVHNAVDPVTINNEITNTKGVDEKIVTFLGRITFQKGPEYFIEAANKVLKKDPNVRFVMAGSGDMMNRMIKRVAELGIATKFHFAGFLKGSEVVDMFSMSDVYVMPSVSEPFGISPLEAMRSSVPVIISKQSGVSEILHHAIKVDFWDIDAMADAIYGLLNYNAISSMFRTLGKDEVENLKWENAAFKVKEIYKSVIS